MAWYNTLFDAVKKMFDWLSDDGTVENIGHFVDNLIEIAGIVVKVISMFNAEPTEAEKREAARNAIKFLKYVPAEDLARLAELKKAGAVDGLHDYQMDALLGNVIAAHVKLKKTQEDRGVCIDV